VGSAHVRLLGAVRFVTDRGEVVDLPSAAQRRVLAVLALASGTTQRTEHLGDSLELSTGSLRTTVSRLRARLGDDVIGTDSTGYRITCAVDAATFTHLLVERPDDRDRLAVLDAALALWDGDALDEFRHEPWAEPEVARLDELRAVAVEERADLLVARSRAGEAVASLQAHVAAHPLRDRPRGLLMAALATDGRQAEALRAYQAYRSFLAEEVGTEPSAFVRSIERRIAAGWGEGDGPVDAGAARPPVGPDEHAVVDLPLHGELAEAPELLGRTRELSWLASDLVAARSGSLRVDMLGGEAGIGKTTLVAAFARAQHRHHGDVVAYGRCSEGAAVPLEPFREIVARLVEHAPLALLRAHCERCGGDLQRIAPRLGDRLWVPPPRTGDDATERHHLFAAIADLLRRVAANGSLTLILDDVHWAEPTALLLLRHLGRALVDAPVLVVASYRDTAVDATGHLWPALGDLDPGRCRWISLAGFDDAAMARLIESITRREVAGGALLGQLHRETAGNPLYAVQLVRHLWESEQLAVEGGEVRLVDRALGDDIPRSLVEVVSSRVRALGDDTAAVLRVAAVLGVDFDDDVLGPVVELPATAVDASLDGAIGAGLLVETGDPRRPLRFTHALVAHALYSGLPPRQRRRLHGRAVQVLRRADRAPRPDTVVELARHCALAGDLTAAQRWAVAAADHAADHLAPSEAAAWCERALGYADERQVPAAERAGLVLRLGEAQRRAGDPRASRTLLDAAALATGADAADVLVRAALANDRGFTPPGAVDDEQLAALEAALVVADRSDRSTYARLLACRAQELVSTPRQDERLASAHEAIALSEASDDPTLLPRMISALVFALWGHDTLDLQRRLTADRALAIGTVQGEPEAFALYAGQLFMHRSFAGRYDEVVPLLDQATTSNPDSIPFRLAHAISGAVVGRDAEARAVLDRGAGVGFGNLPLDYLWRTSVVGYAVLAIELADRTAAAELYTPSTAPPARATSAGRAWLDRAGAIAAECGSAVVATQVERTRRGDALL